MITLSEESRRMQDMMKMYAMNGAGLGDFGSEGETLILNASHPLVQYVTAHRSPSAYHAYSTAPYHFLYFISPPAKNAPAIPNWAACIFHKGRDADSERQPSAGAVCDGTSGRKERPDDM